MDKLFKEMDEVMSKAESMHIGVFQRKESNGPRFRLEIALLVEETKDGERGIMRHVFNLGLDDKKKILELKDLIIARFRHHQTCTNRENSTNKDEDPC